MTAALPVYGKQYIRFMESGRVPENLSLDAFVLVAIDTANPAPTEPPTLKLLVAAGEAFGVLQQRFNLATSGFATDLNRQASVATSGLLLVKSDPAAPQSQNDALKVDAFGRSSNAGGAGAVTVDGTTPIVRHRVEVGGIDMVLVAFN